MYTGFSALQFDNFLKTTTRYLQLWSIPFIFISCSVNEYDMDYSLTTDPTIQKYFDRFESEAVTYGMDIDLDSKHIYGVLSVLDEDSIGNCRYRKNEPRKISVDREYWQSASDLEREYIIFHELGHCYLERSHDDSQNKEGECLSMMQSGENACIMNYSLRTRDAYLKELFNNF